MTAQISQLPNHWPVALKLAIHTNELQTSLVFHAEVVDRLQWGHTGDVDQTCQVEL